MQFHNLSAKKKQLASSDPAPQATGEIKEIVSERLVEELRELQQNRWPGVLERMGTSELVSFTKEILELEDAPESSAIRGYCEELQDAVEDFAFNEMERVVGDFPDLVDSLRTS